MAQNPYEVMGSPEPESRHAKALRLVRGPAVTMQLLGYGLSLVFGAGLATVLSSQDFRLIGSMGVACAFGLGVSVTLLRCGASFHRCESKQMAILGAILAFIGCLPIGFFVLLWTLKVLAAPEVKQAMR
jgi:formate-dependent nitrite reductase membrane component NrfD